MTDNINTGEILEALNDKVDRDCQNVDTTSGADAVIEYQLPTSSNNYTWYRLYKSGWIEQGGYIENGTSTYEKTTVYLVKPMANVYYHTSCTIRWGNETAWYTSTGGAGMGGVTDIAGPVSDITTISFSIQKFSAHSWEVKGMAAQS